MLQKQNSTHLRKPIEGANSNVRQSAIGATVRLLRYKTTVVQKYDDRN